MNLTKRITESLIPLKTFQEAIRTRDFTLTAQLQLTRETGRESVLQQADILGPVADAILVTDNPGGSVHMSTLAASSLLIQQGVDPIAQMTCRDRNNIALQSDLLGAQALGITNLLIQRGDKLPEAHRPKTKQMFDISSRDLINAARSVNRESKSTDFHIGAVIMVFNPESEWRAKSLVAKADAGARFLQTQMCFDMDLLRRYMARLVAIRLTRRVHIVVSVATLPSGETARWVRDNIRGSVMPDAVIRRLDQASDPEQEGIRLCAELLQELKEIPGVSGANVLTPGNVATIPTVIRAAGLRD
jgi:methylenetetrahydrofolate reductase (NADPH)